MSGPPERPGGAADAARPRVLHVSQPVEAGVAVVVHQLAADQVAAGWEVAVACPPGGPLAGWVAAAGARHLPWPATRQPGPSTARETAHLRRLLRAWRPDLLHLHSSKAGLAGRLAARGRVTTVYQPHAWSFEAVGGAVRRAATAWERAATRWTDAVACVSEAERATGEAHGVRARWLLLRNGVDTGRFRPATAAERAAARRALGLTAPLVVVCVGRLAEQKGQDVLLEAWARLGPPPGAVLVLVGDGPERDRLARAAGPGVVLAGPRDDVRPHYAAADLVVQPSRWEGASLTALEALASGLPLVTTDVAGSREAVAPGCGAVVPPGDAGALAAALRTRLDDAALREAEGAAARAAAVADWDLRGVLAANRVTLEQVLRE
ncbi:MAG TPA: glycosyltransferase, partial [Miltoncostaeaceae bacterium]|nr:glycosyltransferase [Miltoncostaeaceae bacterium]